MTHDQEEAFELADRIGLVHRGRLVEAGPPEKLYHQPRTEYTATFIGGGNVLVGRREGQTIRLGQTRLPMPPTAPPHDEGVLVRILFRPETAVVQPEPFDPQKGIISLGKGTILEQIFSGPFQRLILAVDALQGTRQLVPEPIYGQRRTRIEVAQPSRYQAEEGGMAVGQEVWLGVRDFHVLKPARLKLLIYADGSPGGAVAVSFGCMLAQAASGLVTLLGLANSADQATVVTERLNQIAQSWLPHLPLICGGSERVPMFLPGCHILTAFLKSVR